MADLMLAHPFLRARTAAATIVILLASSGAPVLYGCAAGADSGTPALRAGIDGSERPETPPNSAQRSTAAQPVATVVDARPAALINGRPVTWGELRPALTDLAGAEALQELVLDRKVEDALKTAGLTITPDDAAAERRLLLESLSDDPNHAIRLLDELRDRQRLGRVRFDALMMRNAALRALVRNNVRITEEAMRNMHELVHGPKRQARLMVLPNLEAAQAAINLVNSGISFADVAVEMSIDSSAPRGGLLEPISQVDPAYPESIRQTLYTLNPGEMSGPVLIDDRYAVVMLVRRIAGDGIRLQDARPALERMVRVQQERLLMDQLARSLLSDTQVTVFDDVLHEAWTRKRR
jgi:hypothetical protein